MQCLHGGCIERASYKLLSRLVSGPPCTDRLAPTAALYPPCRTGKWCPSSTLRARQGSRARSPGKLVWRAAIAMAPDRGCWLACRRAALHPRPGCRRSLNCRRLLTCSAENLARYKNVDIVPTHVAPRWVLCRGLAVCPPTFCHEGLRLPAAQRSAPTVRCPAHACSLQLHPQPSQQRRLPGVQ